MVQGFEEMWESDEDDMGFPEDNDNEDDERDVQDATLGDGGATEQVVLMSFPPPPPSSPPPEPSKTESGSNNDNDDNDSSGGERGKEHRTAGPHAASTGAGRTSPLSGTNAREEELDPLAVSAKDVRKFSPGDVVVTVVASAGNNAG